MVIRNIYLMFLFLRECLLCVLFESFCALKNVSSLLCVCHLVDAKVCFSTIYLLLILLADIRRIDYRTMF